MRIIDADAFDECLKKAEIEAKKNRRYVFASALNTIRGNLANAFTIEPQIIRCKACKHRMPYDWMFSEVWQSKDIDDYPEDEIGCVYCDMSMGANDFCSRAERRGEQDED